MSLGKTEVGASAFLPTNPRSGYSNSEIKKTEAMIETKFKDTEIGKIPREWKVTSLRNELILLTDYDANGSFADMASNVHTTLGKGYAWFVRATDLENNTPISEVYYVDEPSYYFLKKSSLFGSELLIAKRGEIGKVYFFNSKTKRATLAPNLYLSKLKDTTDSKWLYYYFKSSFGNHQLRSINASTTLGALYKEDVKNLLIPSPPLSEQRRIADALSKVDSLIESLDKLIAKKQAIKRGAMQELLTGKKRLPGFEGEWKTRRLGDIATMNSGGTPTSSNQDYYGGNINFLSISDMTASGKYIKSTEKTITELGLNNSSARIFPKGTLMYAMYASLGKCSISNVETAISQAILGFKLTDEINRDFLYYHFCYIENDVKLKGQTGTQTNLSKAIVENFTLLAPSLPEQRAIAHVLSSMDAEIEALERKRDKYRQVKQGMMLDLLTGRIRLTDN